MVNKCGENQYWNECGNLCDRSCLKVFESHVCPLVCAQAACACSNGFYRLNQTHCVPLNQCFGCLQDIWYLGQQLHSLIVLDVCGANEELSECGPIEPQCEVHCSTSPKQPCPKECGPPKCLCKEGFIRHNGQCVPTHNCSPSSKSLTEHNVLHLVQTNSELIDYRNSNSVKLINTDFGSVCDNLTEYFSLCGVVDNNCEPSCHRQPICPQLCGDAKCTCKAGYVRANTETRAPCIPREHCAYLQIPPEASMSLTLIVPCVPQVLQALVYSIHIFFKKFYY